MLRVLLLILGTSLVPVLGTEVCLCTDSEVLIRKQPSPTSSVTGKLTRGSCLNASEFERKGQWLKIAGEEIQSGYLLESDDIHPRSCPDHISMRATSNFDAIYCHRLCPSSQCCSADSSTAHHHAVHCGSSCDHHHCCSANATAAVWSHWGSCSVTCGTGTRQRHCLHHCSSVHVQTQNCHNSACPVVTSGSVHLCDKESVVQALAFQIPENCTALGHDPYTQFVVQNCRAPVSIGNWVKGAKTHENCDTIPLYSPVAAFYTSGHHHVFAGVFVGCETNGDVKVIISSCGHPPQVEHVPSNNAIFSHIYQVKW